MKIIEGLKQIKSLHKKVHDIQAKVEMYCADLSIENSVYPDTKKQIAEWLQSNHDIIREISHLHFRIQKTNLLTMVTIELDGKLISKSITEWLLRRKTLCALELSAWKRLGDRGLKSQKLNNPNGSITEIHVRRYFDPVEKDKMTTLLESEPSIIDGKIEIVNAITDLLE